MATTRPRREGSRGRGGEVTGRRAPLTAQWTTPPLDTGCHAGTRRSCSPRGLVESHHRTARRIATWHDRPVTDIPARLSIVTLGARDIGVLRSFYRSLGWPELPSGDDTWTGFLLGGVLLALFPLGDLTAEAAPGSANPTGWSGVTLACTVDTRDGVDGAFAAAVAAGAIPVADATDRSWGGRSAFIADPEGNRWEITWGPRATFDARGALLSWD
jgi:uncharacterized protein